ncbi:MAG: DegT/DnrJ/EryC1/StrS family aminotransferase [Chloroflexi bacterium]|nr:DegT/DnrJ/EryC1/StrS family aminotransferase [Chloroflexota bacterium]MBT7079967.1 DegT/DnrJ/EryC1/StrS family aminotransferase [Chloroflexota bacterium]MBT7289503.1 DegT/DnrJ/EryC1/StrS family aminotransferase [Chloroflexota bacterium]
MKVPLVDLVTQYNSIKAEMNEAIQQVLDNGQFILGPRVAELEEKIAAYHGLKHAVGVASGTDALVLALRALDIGPGDEVIVPAFTFFATAEAVSAVGATPVFVDIDLQTYCIDTNQIESRISKKTKAIIPVHLYGHPADIDAILNIAGKHNLKVIEDNAQAFGAEYKGRKTGSMGHVSCFSFFPSKNLGTYGDGGMLATNDADVADKVKMLRAHGWKKKYFPVTIAYNSRLDELHAAILLVKLKYVDKWNEKRWQTAQKYNKLLNAANTVIPTEASYAKHVYHMYVIRVQRRNELQSHLKQNEVASAIYYPIPLHLLEAYTDLGYNKGDFPNSEKACQETLAIPMYPDMPDEQAEVVVKSITAF